MSHTDRFSDERRTIVPVPSGRGVVTLFFNRPDKSNAFDGEMRRSFIARFDELVADPEVRVIVLRGRGRHFCAGSDMSSIGGSGSNTSSIGGSGSSDTSNIGGPGSDDRIEMLARVDACPKPTVAVVQGACLGHGLGLACCCDVVLAASDAFFSIPELRLGIPPLGLMPLLIRSMGFAAFRHQALRGGRFTAAEAQALGLVHQVASSDELDAVLATACDELLRGSPAAIRTLKQAWHDLSGVPDLRAAMLALAQQERAAVASAEAQAGLAAAREKRDPPWSI